MKFGVVLILATGLLVVCSPAVFGAPSVNAKPRACGFVAIAGKAWRVEAVVGLTCPQATAIVRSAAAKSVPRNRVLGTFAGLRCVSYSPKGRLPESFQCFTDDARKTVNAGLRALGPGLPTAS